MHTGRYTLPYSGWAGLSKEDTTIADLCRGRPVDTALVFDCPMYRLPKFGYTCGFDKVWFLHGHEGDDYFFENDALIHYEPKDFIAETILINGTSPAVPSEKRKRPERLCRSAHARWPGGPFYPASQPACARRSVCLRNPHPQPHRIR